MVMQGHVENGEDQSARYTPSTFRLCDDRDFIGAESEWARLSNPQNEGSTVCLDDLGALSNWNSGNNATHSMAPFIYWTACPSYDPTCEKDPEKIKTFFKSFYIMQYYLSDNIDFSKFGEKPVVKVPQFSTVVTIDPEKFVYVVEELVYNHIETQNSWIQFGQTVDYNFTSRQ